MDKATLATAATGLLKSLVATPSFSREEEGTALLIEDYLRKNGVTVHRYLNNIFAVNRHFDPQKATLLLNSHHDTVKPNKGYTLDPFEPVEKNGKLFGLGSNDAGGCLVSLIAAFQYFYDQPNLRYNLILAATAEEEISGPNGVEALLKAATFNELLHNKSIDCAIVGEPTLMQMAVAERGLMVLDCVAHGKAGHAARGEGENAIYKAMMDIEWIYVHRFEKLSGLLGPVKMTVTSIETENKAHNVVPAECRFVIDVRVNEHYAMEEVIEVLKQHLQSEVHPRSTRLRSTFIPIDHPLVQAGLALGRSTYGSPTTSDKALMPFPALKMGPGDSARSHTADEFIFVQEIEEGISLYIDLLSRVI
jgi:acetylornithine deacetylase